ncbi:MAG: CIA30 family protein [Bacteroidota bacterium]
MKISTIVVVLALGLFAPKNAQFDFGKEKSNDWNTVVDGVMGGQSTAEIAYQANALQFSGDISLANYGGFSSIRSPWTEMDLSQAKEAVIRLKGDGRTYGLMLETAQAFFLPYFKTEFSTKKGEWMEVRIPLQGMPACSMGEMTGETATAEKLKAIKRVGLILSDKKEGPFVLDIDYLRFE